MSSSIVASKWSAEVPHALRSTLEAVLCALEYEDRWDFHAALKSYKLAASQTTRIMEDEAIAAQDPLIREACKGFLQTYNNRVEDLELQIHKRIPRASSEQEDEEHLNIIHKCKREVCGNLDEVAGHSELKEQLREGILFPMKFPGLFTGIRKPPSNFLLHGPPGTGKTLLVEKTAAEAGVTLFALSPSSVMSKWSGESENTIRGVFRAAKACEPAIIFMDEVDSLAPRRQGQDDMISRRILTEILIQMTQISQEDARVFVFGATNRIQDCDQALLRRFDRRINVPLPDAEVRRSFFELMLSKPEMASELSEPELERLVGDTAEYTGSDLKLVCREAALIPVRQMLQEFKGVSTEESAGYAAGSTRLEEWGNIRGITIQDFIEALKTVKPSPIES